MLLFVGLDLGEPWFATQPHVRHILRTLNLVCWGDPNSTLWTLMTIWKFPKNGGTPKSSKMSPFWYWNLHGLPPNSATPFQFPCHLKSLMGITSGPVFNFWSKRHRPCVLLPLALPMLGLKNPEWQTGKIEPNWKQPGCVAKHRVAAINLFCRSLS